MGENFGGKGGRGTAFHFFFELFDIILPGTAKQEHFTVIFLNLFARQSVKLEFFGLAIGRLALVLEWFLLQRMGFMRDAVILVFLGWICINIIFEVEFVG